PVLSPRTACPAPGPAAREGGGRRLEIGRRTRERTVPPWIRRGGQRCSIDRRERSPSASRTSRARIASGRSTPRRLEPASSSTTVCAPASIAQGPPDGGRVFKTVGDAFCAAFPNPRGAIETVLASQQWLPALALDTAARSAPGDDAAFDAAWAEGRAMPLDQ